MYVGTPAPPDDAEWEEYVEALRAHSAAYPDGGLAVFPDAGTHGRPSASQRKSASSALPPRFRIAIVHEKLDHPIIRGVIKVIAWLVPNTRAFVPHDAQGVQRHLGIDAAEWAEVARLVNALRDELSLNVRAR